MSFFEDMFSSSRGAGFMGTLLALVVLVGFGSLYMFVFDEGLNGGEKSIQSVVKEQAEVLSSLQSRLIVDEQMLSLEGERKNTVDELAKTLRVIEMLETQKNDALATITNVKNSLEMGALEWEKYKMLYRNAERKRAENEVIGDLITKSGKTYKSVTLKKIDNLRITFSHADGNGNMKFSDVPDEMIDRFQMTVKAAQEAIGEEKKIDVLGSINKSIYVYEQEILFQKNQLHESEEIYLAKKADVQQSQNRKLAHENAIRNLEQRIAEMANKRGLNNSNQLRQQIQEKRGAIALERAKESSFVTLSKSYIETKNQRDAHIKELENSISDLKVKREKVIQETKEKNAGSKTPQ